ncbi:MAG: hypothetical protein AAF514_05980 [Verrucomicrobiota bacterium]
MAKDRLYLESAYARELVFLRDLAKTGLWLHCQDETTRHQIDEALVKSLGEDSAILFLAVLREYEEMDCNTQTDTWVVRKVSLQSHVGVWNHRRAEKGRFYNTMIRRTADAGEEVAVAYRLRLGSYIVKAILDTNQLPDGPEADAITKSQPGNFFKRHSFW